MLLFQELGPGGPVEGKPSEVVASNSSLASGALSPQSSDLALIRTANVSSIFPTGNMCWFYSSSISRFK